MIELNNRLKAIWLALGYLASYSAVGIFKEKIFKNNFDGEKFVYPVVLVVIQCVANAISAKAVMLTHKQPENETPQKYFLIIAVFDILTLVATNMSLLYVPFVVSVVGRTCKPIPVMIFTALIAKKFYTIQRYIFVAVIAFGVVLFVYEDGMEFKNDDFIGYILILAILLLEGLLSVVQVKMRTSAKPSSINYMYYVNCWCLLLSFPLLFINFEGLRFIEFCSRHNEAILYVSAATLAGISGYYFLSAMISNFGPFPAALVSTTRKFFSVLVSSLLFGNVLSLRQWIATVIIFETLILDMFFGKRKITFKKEEKTGDKSEVKTDAEKLEVKVENKTKIEETVIVVDKSTIICEDFKKKTPESA